MRCLILTGGMLSGDVVPFIALANALKEAGHNATFCAPSQFESLANEYGINFRSIDPDSRTYTHKITPHTAGKIDIHKRRQRTIAKKQLAKLISSYHEKIGEICDEIGQGGVDIIVYHHPLICVGEVAERLAAPAIPVCLQPFWVPTNSFPNPVFRWPVPHQLNHASYLHVAMKWRSLHRYGARLRQRSLGTRASAKCRNGLRRPDGTSVTTLQPFSHHVLPAPPHYPDHVLTTNYWFLPTAPNWTPSAELSDFLASEHPTVAIAFGSAIGHKPDRLTRVAARAVRLAGVRAVLAGGNRDIARQEGGDNICHVDKVPYHWLFARTSAVVHHGGIGTASTALAAGKPQVVCPYTLEHHFFAERMRAIGVADHGQRRDILNSEGLAAALRRTIASDDMAARAEEVSREVTKHDGTSAAIKILESIA